MAPNKKGKKAKHKEQQRKSTSSASSDPPLSVHDVPAGDALESALGPSLAANPSPPPIATSPGPSSPPATGEKPIQFSVVYMETSLEFRYEEEAYMSARSAVAEAVSIATGSFSSALGVSNMEFLVYPSFPIEFGGRDLTLREWNVMGKDPFVAIGPKDQSKGFCPLLATSRAKVEEVRQFNSDLIDTGLKELGLMPTTTAACKGFKYLTKVAASLRKEVSSLRKDNTSLREEVSSLRNDVASLLGEQEKMRKVRRRILVERAQQKAVRELGLTAADVRTWQSFFTEHAQKLRTDLGVSKELHQLLLFGKGKLNITVHHSQEFELAEAVTSMRESPLKVQFEEAFAYVFGHSAASSFED